MSEVQCGHVPSGFQFGGQFGGQLSNGEPGRVTRLVSEQLE